MSNRSKYFSSRGNCQRAARVVLGKSAALDIDFVLHENPEKKGAWAWEPKTAAGVAAVTEPDAPAPAKPKKTKAPKGERSSVVNQPAMIVVLHLMQRVNGATTEEIAERGGSNLDTGRGKVSLLRKAGVPITTTREGRFVRHKVPAEWSPT